MAHTRKRTEAKPKPGKTPEDSCLESLVKKAALEHHHPTWHERFHTFGQKTAEAVGSPWAFAIAVLIIVSWAALGPFFHYSDTWQLVINTGTTIVTFLMVFLIQNTQNRDARAFHLKLDELIRAQRGARNDLVELEQMSDEEISELQTEFEKLRDKARARKLGRE
jgi:low affinity Fe/Cu permease